MEVILLQKVENLGNLGDKVTVKNGYGRNYLIPTGRAVPANKENLEAFEARRAELEQHAAELQAQAEARRERLHGMRVTIPARAGDEGRLFGSVGTLDIANAVQALGEHLEKHEVRLPAGAFRTCGEFEVTLHLLTDVDAVITLEIVPEQ